MTVSRSGLMIYLFGLKDRPEFSAIVADIRSRVAMEKEFELREVHFLLSDFVPGDFFRSADPLAACAVGLFLESFPGEYPPSVFREFRRRWPLAVPLLIVGPLGEGEGRTGNVPAGVFRVYWHRWFPTGRDELIRFLRKRPSRFSAPPLATDDDFFLNRDAFNLRESESPARKTRPVLPFIPVPFEFFHRPGQKEPQFPKVTEGGSGKSPWRRYLRPRETENDCRSPASSDDRLLSGIFADDDNRSVDRLPAVAVLAEDRAMGELLVDLAEKNSLTAETISVKRLLAVSKENSVGLERILFDSLSLSGAEVYSTGRLLAERFPKTAIDIFLFAPQWDDVRLLSSIPRVRVVSKPFEIAAIFE